MSSDPPDGPNPAQTARHFLHLLDDVHRIHGLFLEEINTLKARVKELEQANSSLNAGFVPEVKGCAVYLVSNEGLIQGWSGGAAELYGYSVEEILGQPVVFLLPGKAELGEVATTRRIRKDGGIFEVVLHDMILQDEKGQATGRVHVEVPVPGEASAIRREAS